MPDNGITRPEFEATIAPIKDDIRGVRMDMGRIEKTFLLHAERLEVLMSEALQKMAFAQGAVAALTFLMGTGVVTVIILAILAQ